MKIILGLMLYLAIEDLMEDSVNIIPWTLLHILIIYHNFYYALLLPFYFVLYKYKGIGLADWIVLIFALENTHNIPVFTAIFMLYSISLLHNKKSPMYPGILIGLIGTLN